MYSDGFRETLEGIPDAFVSDGFIELDKRSRADHIGVQQYRELAGWSFSHENPYSLSSAGICDDSILGD
jgi:hypothetical protein